MFNSFHCIPVSYVSFPFFLSIQVQSIVAVSFFLAIFQNHPFEIMTFDITYIFHFQLNVLYRVPCTVYTVCTPSASWQFNPFQKQTLFLMLSVVAAVATAAVVIVAFISHSKTNEALAFLCSMMLFHFFGFWCIAIRFFSLFCFIRCLV